MGAGNGANGTGRSKDEDLGQSQKEPLDGDAIVVLGDGGTNEVGVDLLRSGAEP